MGQRRPLEKFSQELCSRRSKVLRSSSCLCKRAATSPLRASTPLQRSRCSFMKLAMSRECWPCRSRALSRLLQATSSSARNSLRSVPPCSTCCCNIAKLLRAASMDSLLASSSLAFRTSSVTPSLARSRPRLVSACSCVSDSCAAFSDARPKTRASCREARSSRDASSAACTSATAASRALVRAAQVSTWVAFVTKVFSLFATSSFKASSKRPMSLPATKRLSRNSPISRPSSACALETSATVNCLAPSKPLSSSRRHAAISGSSWPIVAATSCFVASSCRQRRFRSPSWELEWWLNSSSLVTLLRISSNLVWTSWRWTSHSFLGTRLGSVCQSGCKTCEAAAGMENRVSRHLGP
mmetsp:Transcript_95676/g.205279  ORF Transcript_95676/g.205279 Transcript_95676/m.205279 type:complete len:355 (-) Transcript_95676:30-1094(-)